MPINPNIALSFKPTYELESPQNIEANVMKLQGAKYANELARMQSQEYARGLQEQEGLRNYLAGRPDLSSQEAQSKLTRYGKPGSDVLKAQDERIKAENEATKANQDIVKLELELNQRALDKIHYPEEYSAYIDKTYENKILKQYLEANGITKEQALKKFKDVVATGPTEFKYYLDEQKMGMKSHRDMLRQQEQGQTGLAKLLNEQARYAPGSVQHNFYEQAIQKEITRTPATQVNVGAPALEKSEMQEKGKLNVEGYKTISNTAKVAAKSLSSLETQEKILDSGFRTGFGVPAQAAGASLLAALGVPEAAKYAANAESFNAALNDSVLAKQLDQRGVSTEGDAKRISATGAQLGNTPEGNKFIITVAKAQLKRDIEQRNFYDKWWKENKTYEGAEDAWYSSEGGKSLFDRPELKPYGGKTQQPAAASATVTPPNSTNVQPYADAEKERRYQEWKRKQGQP